MWDRDGAEKRQEIPLCIQLQLKELCKRNDGNPNTYAFVGSPELITALHSPATWVLTPLLIRLRTIRAETEACPIRLTVELPQWLFS